MATYFYKSETDWGVFPVIFLCGFVFANSIGVSPISFVILGEIFNQNVKDKAVGLSMTWSYMLLVGNSLLYPLISEILGPAFCFMIYGFCSFLSYLFVVFSVPETKGKTFQEIQDLLQ